MQSTLVIQSYTRGYLTRKREKEKVRQSFDRRETTKGLREMLRKLLFFYDRDVDSERLVSNIIYSILNAGEISNTRFYLTLWGQFGISTITLICCQTKTYRLPTYFLSNVFKKWHLVLYFLHIVKDIFKNVWNLDFGKAAQILRTVFCVLPLVLSCTWQICGKCL